MNKRKYPLLGIANPMVDNPYQMVLSYMNTNHIGPQDVFNCSSRPGCFSGAKDIAMSSVPT